MRHRDCPNCTCDWDEPGFDWLLLLCVACLLLGYVVGKL